MILRFTLDKPPDIVFDYLSDMQKFVSVHPVIHRITPLHDGRYRVYEKLKMGFIPYSFTYFATLESDREAGQVRIVATVQRITRIEMEFFIHEKEGVTQVEEHITIRSLLPVHGLLRKVFREQHPILFRNIESAPL